MILSPEQFESATGRPLTTFRHQCHAASIALVKSGALPDEARVARGVTDQGVFGQHSWVVIGDPYDERAEVVDATIWSYVDAVPHVRWIRPRPGSYVPHGAGHFMLGEPPESGGGPEIMPPGLSGDAQWFLASIRSMIGGPLDHVAWRGILAMPVQGWPSAEITAAAYDDPTLTALTRVDVVGMLTDRNPGGLYLRTEK